MICRLLNEAPEQVADSEGHGKMQDNAGGITIYHSAQNAEMYLVKGVTAFTKNIKELRFE
jgi:hypothetical protein